MKTFHCTCGQLIFFQNVSCVNCHRELGFLPDCLMLTSLDPAENGLWRPTAKEVQGTLYKKCLNYEKENVCNWMVPEREQDAEFCVSCRLNEIIPDLSLETNRNLWARVEDAKRLVVYTLMRLDLPLESRSLNPQQGLAFRFLSDKINADGSISKVMTGHEQGVITLNIAEADDSTREKVRNAMKEPYRTLLGHFRHEVGHYYWDRLVGGTAFLESYRQIFGDERSDYNQALVNYYKSGAPANWQEKHISAYSTAHPWEDWAETWAHFLHMQDVLETANDFGLVGKQILLDPKTDLNAPDGRAGANNVLPKNQSDRGRSQDSPERSKFDAVIFLWSQLAIALNSINRSMGLPDLYPFVLSPAVVEKMRFIYEVISSHSKTAAAAHS
jgi:hypothetical protein